MSVRPLPYIQTLNDFGVGHLRTLFDEPRKIQNSAAQFVAGVPQELLGARSKFPAGGRPATRARASR